MGFGTYFRAFSYAMIAVAMLALVLAGGLSAGLALVFLLVMVAGWLLENTKWQLPERYGLGIVLLSIPLFYLDWHYQKAVGEPTERLGVTALAHLIVFLSAVKLLQVKKDRDWVFLYLISFFEVLLAAGLSFSPVFLGTLTIYLLCGLSAVTAFEIQKARRSLPATETRLLVPPDSRVFKKSGLRSWRGTEAARLPVVAVALLLLIFVLALPLFLIAPRSGAAALTRSGGAVPNFIGFSENVTLGQIGTLKQNDAIVMRVRVDDTQPRDLRWRGVALQGDLPYVRVDEEGSIQSRRHDFERIMYKALSDATEPRMDYLRNDLRPLPVPYYRYLQLPERLDPRIGPLATTIVLHANASNRYDTAKAIESYLQREYAYSFDMKATGPDPLADFLFNVRAGHCEYFASAMVLLLRTHGIASRLVNGFTAGEYNDAADAYTVRQFNAHSWVEVYFPATQSWVTFDPTPPAGRTEPVRTGLAAQLQKYGEAIELLWFQYVVGYDKQEQRSLETSIQHRVFDYGRMASNMLNTISRYLSGNVLAVAVGVTAFALTLLLVLFNKRIWRWTRAGLARSTADGRAYSNVQFYERLISLMEQRGLSRDQHLTPLEFADTLRSNEVMVITRAYNRVRFGGQKLSATERKEVERALFALEGLEPRVNADRRE